MANDGTMDMSGVTMAIDGSELINAILPKLVSMLASNPQLLSQLTQAVTTKVLQSARTTGTAFAGYAGGTQTQAATRINTNAKPR